MLPQLGCCRGFGKDQEWSWEGEGKSRVWDIAEAPGQVVVWQERRLAAWAGASLGFGMN
jgi:hypothetical protein